MTYHEKTTIKGATPVHLAAQHLRTKDAGDPFAALSQRIGDLTDVAVKRIDAAEAKIKSVGDLADALDKKMARPGFLAVANEAPSWGKQFAAAEGLKRFGEDNHRPGRFRLDVKTTVTGGATSGGPLGRPTRDEAVILPQRRMTVRDLLSAVSISSNTVEYPNQTGRPTAAAPVAEGDLKPESAMALGLETATTRVIAHWIPASRQILDDAPQLADVIDGELRYGLMLAEEAQLLNGSGIGQNLLGLIPRSTAHVDPLALATPTMLDRIGSAILQTALAEYMADGIIMHPADWMRIRLLKDADGKYLLGDPQAKVTPSLFGVPVVPTQAIAIDKFLVGEFRVAATIYDRWEARVEVSTEHADFFTRNLVAILAEERLALAVKRPLALTYGDFGNVA